MENIIIDYDSLDSIKAAEKKKERLENDGFTLIHTGGSCNRRILTFDKI